MRFFNVLTMGLATGFGWATGFILVLIFSENVGIFDSVKLILIDLIKVVCQVGP